MSPGCVDTISAAVRAAERRFSRAVGMILIDTFNKGVAAGVGDEDKARDQNRVAANLRRAQELLGVHVALVGHTGKDERRGARGSNAYLGDVDVMVQISDGEIRQAEVTKGNDQPERILTHFRLDMVHLGVDEDGDEITTAIVAADVVDAPAAVKPKRKRTEQTELARRYLAEAIIDHGEAVAIIPPGASKGARVTAWRDHCYRRGLGGPGEEGMRKAFHRAKTNLALGNDIGEHDGWVWLPDPVL
jgi:hypothetical protein